MNQQLIQTYTARL